MRLHSPEQFFGHLGRAMPVSVRQSTATGTLGTSHSGQFSAMQLQTIAQVVESETVGQLTKEQAHHVTPGRKTACLVLGSSPAG